MYTLQGLKPQPEVRSPADYYDFSPKGFVF